MSATLFAGSVGLAPALAQDGAGRRRGRPGTAQGGSPLEIEASTPYTAPTSDAIPPTLRSEFTPAGRPRPCRPAEIEVG